VKDLSDTEIANIAMYLNMDMIGSPNYVRLVFDGDGSNSSLLEPNLKPGTPMAHIEATYHQYFDQVGLPVAQEPLEYAYGSTDHTAFYDAGIPISDLFTGHYLPKTEEQAAIFGGKAGEPWDPCYHQACDTIDNVNFMVMEEMARAAAHALAMYGSKDGDLFA
jgi:Zn-dependent M28 family amino/carboxypeptidase